MTLEHPGQKRPLAAGQLADWRGLKTQPRQLGVILASCSPSTMLTMQAAAHHALAPYDLCSCRRCRPLQWRWSAPSRPFPSTRRLLRSGRLRLTSECKGLAAQPRSRLRSSSDLEDGSAASVFFSQHPRQAVQPSSCRPAPYLLSTSTQHSLIPCITASLHHHLQAQDQSYTAAAAGGGEEGSCRGEGEAEGGRKQGFYVQKAPYYAFSGSGSGRSKLFIAARPSPAPPATIIALRASQQAALEERERLKAEKEREKLEAKRCVVGWGWLGGRSCYSCFIGPCASRSDPNEDMWG